MTSGHSEGKVSREIMADNLVPLHVRDNCAGILIPLNKCRRANYYLPWHCEEEKHSYEICMYKEYEKRRQLKKEDPCTVQVTLNQKESMSDFRSCI